MVDGRFFGHFFWKVVGSCAHTRESRTATVHGAPYTVNSCVVVGAIYAYMCTYSYRTQCTVHGELACGGGGNIRIHVYLQLLYTVNSRVEGAFMCGSYSRLQGTFTCGSYSHVEGTFTCGAIHVWRWGAVCTHVSHVQLPYTVHRTR